MIDILLASYNGETYIKQQIESIMAQTVQDWSLVIHDDRSSDHTGEIVKMLIQKAGKEMDHRYGQKRFAGVLMI